MKTKPEEPRNLSGCVFTEGHFHVESISCEALLYLLMVGQYDEIIW